MFVNYHPLIFKNRKPHFNMHIKENLKLVLILKIHKKKCAIKMAEF